MIKNERQYRITRAQLRTFQQALAELANSKEEGKHGALKLQLQEAALRSKFADLQEELHEYESLQSNSPGILELTSLEELPRALIRARIATGLSQADLAEKLGLKEQQIQRYEATDYAGVSMQRISDVVGALGIKVRKELILPTAPASIGTLFKRLREVGLTRDFVETRLLPSSLRVALKEADYSSEFRESIPLEIASAVGKIFNWTADTVFGDKPLSLDNAVLSSARFKVPTKTKESFTNAYTVYAHYLALLVHQCVDHMPKLFVSTDPIAVRQVITSSSHEFSLRAVLEYTWSLGIAVLPLRDSGAFHGACWRISGRNIIVVKQGADFEARWIIDVLHEMFHAAQEPEKSEFSYVEEEDILAASRVSPEEKAANKFAIAIALDNRPEDLLQRCIKEASGKVEWIKRIIPRVASEEGVNSAVLANVLAHRLSRQGINWWPTAAAFQEKSASAWQTARDIFLERVDMTILNEQDRELLVNALAGEI